jgi:hypothetical protein
MHLSMGLLVANTKRHQILDRVITQSAARLNVMDLKTLDRARTIGSASRREEHFRV